MSDTSVFRRRTLTSEQGLALVAGAVVIVALLLRLYRLSAQSFWFDEGTTLNMSDMSSLSTRLGDLWALNTGGERFQPLYNLVMAYWRRAFGDSELGLRSFSVLNGMVAVVLVILTARKLFGSLHAVFTGLIAATSGFALFYSQEARPYAFLMAISALHIFCLSPVLSGQPAEETSPWWRRANAAVLFVGYFASIFIMMLSAALAFAHALIDRDLKKWLQWWGPAAVVAIPSLIFYFGSDLVADPTHRINVTRYGFPVFESLVFVVYGLLVGQTFGPTVAALHSDERWSVVAEHASSLGLLLLTTLGLAALLALVLNGRQTAWSSRRGGGILTITAVIGIMLGLALSVATKVTWLPRHSAFVWVPMVLVLPLVVTGARRGWATAGGVLLALLLVMNVSSVRNYFCDYAHAKDDYRGVATFLKQEEQAQVPSVLVYGYLRLLRHYHDDRTIALPDRDYSRLSEYLGRLTNGSEEVLLVLSHEHFWQLESGEDLASLLAESYSVEMLESFANISVYRARRRGVESERSSLN